MKGKITKLLCILEIDFTLSENYFLKKLKFFFFYKVYRKNMEKEKLIVKKKLPNSKVLLASVAQRRHVGQVKVQITEKGLEETHQGSTHSIEFDFDVKFSYTLSPPEVKFQKESDTVTYGLASESQVNCWRDVLKNKLNQRGFHEQFKPYKKIGKGNFATVFLVKKIESKTYYAVKAFSKEAAYSEEKGKECLIKEIEVMRKLNHKNTMKLHEVFQSENSLYIIFELLEGGQLEQKIKSKYKFKPHQILKIMKGILEGLKEMHSKKIMHRDLKPENLLFRKDSDLDCVIADFGLAQFSDQPQYLFVRCGTPGYVAPEVINIKDMSTKYDPICDLFSLGLIFHILLTGKSAFPGKNYNQVLAQNRASNIPLTGEIFKNVPPAAMDLLAKMLRKNPHERISAEEALKHKFFESQDISDEEDTYQISSPMQNMNSMNNNSKENYGECDSPLLTSANAKRKQDKNIKKDSCVEFKMGKENVMTGKTETVGTMDSKLSMMKASDKARKPKVSQFSAQKN